LNLTSTGPNSTPFSISNLGLSRVPSLFTRSDKLLYFVRRS
jgi:hypothetical protein